jgi:hypothetical protein
MRLSRVDLPIGTILVQEWRDNNETPALFAYMNGNQNPDICPGRENIIFLRSYTPKQRCFELLSTHSREIYIGGKSIHKILKRYHLHYPNRIERSEEYLIDRCKIFCDFHTMRELFPGEFSYRKQIRKMVTGCYPMLTLISGIAMGSIAKFLF